MQQVQSALASNRRAASNERRKRAVAVRLNRRKYDEDVAEEVRAGVQVRRPTSSAEARAHPAFERRVER
jgi:hypothetical protein